MSQDNKINNGGFKITGDLKHPSINSEFKIEQNSVNWNISWSENDSTTTTSSSDRSTSEVNNLPYHIKVNPNELKNVTEPSSIPSWKSGGTSHILPDERKRATFDVNELTKFLYGGEKAVAKRKFILSPTEGLDMSDIYNWERETLLEQHVKLFLEVHESYWDNYKPTREEINHMSTNYMIKGSLMNHYGLFLPTIRLQGSDEQIQIWGQRALTNKIIGSYAQTELGHGSNVRGLQTTATYDKNSRQFILNTPTLPSMKWWPGTLGKLATHAVVYAQLLIDGKEYGLHAFIVQLRDENHRPLEGIELGDLGNKLGDNANDTGYMRLKDVRIPREFLLNRYQTVTENGEYIVSPEKKKNEKLGYVTMMFARSSMILTASGILARACIIAIRYSAVRKQGFVDPQSKSYLGDERSILDYQVQRFRLIKQLALSYAINFAGTWMFDLIRSVDYSTDNKEIKIDNMAEVVATSAGLKSLCTFLATQGIEDCRKACGGNGYLMNSGIAAVSSDYVWQTTAEGDYILLFLLTGKFLLKMFKEAKEGKKVVGPASYLSDLVDPNFEVLSSIPKETTNVEDYTDNLNYLLSWYRFRALFLINKVGTKFGVLTMTSGKPFMEVWNDCSYELVDAVRAHCFFVLVEQFILALNRIQNEQLKRAMADLCSFFAISNILEDQWSGLIGLSQYELIKEASAVLLDRIRPNCIALVDAFDIPDRVLNSTIGSYDGNVYERLYEAARRSTLNRVDPFVGYQQYLRPRLDLEFLKNGNKLPSKL